MNRSRVGVLLLAVGSLSAMLVAPGRVRLLASPPAVDAVRSTSQRVELPDAAAARPLTIPLGLDLFMPVPAGNLVTVEKLALGRRLFFDPRLSGDGSTACATCHDPGRAFTDGRPLARGVGGRLGRRNSPTLVNRGYGAAQFLDGRAATLEAQVLQPIEDDSELGHTLNRVILSLRADPEYRRDFRTAFGREPDETALAQSLATYVRSVLSGDAPFDRYQAGDRTALTADQREGLRLFLGKARCSSCHVGPNFTDEEFHNTGVAWPETVASTDDGLTRGFLDAGRFGVTGRTTDLGAFKTPTLREIARTAPYMHDGSVGTLEEVVDFYDGGGRPNPYLDRQVRPLRLTEDDRRALVLFLESLSGVVRDGGG
jgi:cytochrome c peroxidase